MGGSESTSFKSGSSRLVAKRVARQGTTVERTREGNASVRVEVETEYAQMRCWNEEFSRAQHEQHICLADSRSAGTVRQTRWEQPQLASRGHVRPSQLPKLDVNACLTRPPCSVHITLSGAPGYVFSRNQPSRYVEIGSHAVTVKHTSIDLIASFSVHPP